MMPGDAPKHGYWGNLSTEDCAVLARFGIRTPFAGGSTVIAQDDSNRDIFIVWSGFTKVVFRIPNRTNVVLAVRGPGDIVGEMAHIRGGERSAAVAGLGSGETLRVPHAEFSLFLSRSGHAANLLRQTLVDRLQEADRDRIAAATLSFGQRLARLLLTLARRFGVREPGGGLTIALLSQEELAACVGGARRTLAREIADWRERGFVSTTRLSITVHRPDELARIVGPAAPLFLTHRAGVLTRRTAAPLR
jgi:CRP/FNR family transcriptional regulator, cyclic AMP receptor protein